MGVGRCVAGVAGVAGVKDVEGVEDAEGQDGDNKVGTNPACKFVNLFRLRCHVGEGLEGVGRISAGFSALYATILYPRLAALEGV